MRFKSNFRNGISYGHRQSVLEGCIGSAIEMAFDQVLVVIQGANNNILGI